jgi:cysteine desulfurase
VLAALRDRLEAEILRLPGTGVNGAHQMTGASGPSHLGTGDSAIKRVPRAANTTNIWFDHLEGEALVIALDLKGVCGERAGRRATPAQRSRATC